MKRMKRFGMKNAQRTKSFVFLIFSRLDIDD